MDIKKATIVLERGDKVCELNDGFHLTDGETVYRTYTQLSKVSPGQELECVRMGPYSDFNNFPWKKYRG